MADSSRTQLLRSTETVFGEVPSTPAMTLQRFTNSSLANKNATAVSTEIRSDRARAELFLLGTDASGAVGYEFSVGTLDPLIEAALCSTWTANVLTNGVTNRSFLMEEGFLDVSQFIQYRGCVVNTMELDITARAIVKASFGFMAAQSIISGATVSGSVIQPSSTVPITSGPAISNLESNTNMTGLKFKSVKLTVNNNVRVREAIGQIGSDDFGRGAMDVTLTMDAYFKTGALYSQFLANSAVPFSFVITDPSVPAKTYTVSIPRMKLPSADPTISGVDTDVMITLTGRGLYDATTGYMLRISRT